MVKKYTLAALTAQLQSLGVGDTICITTELTGELIDAISYHLPLTVTEYTTYANNMAGVFDDYELCPRCGLPLSRTYQAHCDKCGQCLHWISKNSMTLRN